MARKETGRGQADESRLVVAGHLVEDLAHSIRSGEIGLNNVPMLIRRIIETEAWKERKLRTGKAATFGRFIDFVTAKPLEGLGEEPAAIKRLISNDPVTLRMFEETIRLGAQGRRNDIVDNVNDVDGRPTGNSKAYTLRRLAKDFPELSAKVERGEMTANAAAIKAGFRKVRSPLEQVEALIPKLSPAEKRHLLSLLQGSI